MSMADSENRVLAIVGQGYVGLPLAMSAVDAGWKVIGIDVSEAKVEQINAGFSPVEDISNLQLQKAITEGSYIATNNFSRVKESSVVILCVPTPLDSNRAPDLTMLRSAASSVATFLNDYTLVVSESTSFPGTLRNVIIPIIEKIKPISTSVLYFASAPERVNPGDVRWNQKNTPRLIGAIDSSSKVRAVSFYESICNEVVSVSSPEVAEAAKLLENAFRLVNIALINEFAQICSRADIGVHEVIDAASTKPYGYMGFRPGIGVGGHCIPIDPLYLTWWSHQLGITPSFIEMADRVNLEMPQYVARRALQLINPMISKPKVLILGVAYKSGVGDVRETPASELRNQLISMGATVGWNDPLVEAWEGTNPVELDWDCDVIILGTKQPGINLTQVLNRRLPILDCTNSFNVTEGIVGL
jgi:UDP-N-acetyl-D-glucosamine dehydrogenase